MKKIEEFGLMESFGMDEITVDDMFDVDGGFCWSHNCTCDGDATYNGSKSC